MQASSNCTDLIIKFEGFSAKLYYDDPKTKLNPTIGYGHRIDEEHLDIFLIMTVSKTYALQLLQQDLKIWEDYLNQHCDITDIGLNQNQFDALCSFYYNVGGMENKPTMLRAFQNKDIHGIGESLLLYDEANHKILPGLVARREAEHDLFFKEI